MQFQHNFMSEMLHYFDLKPHKNAKLAKYLSYFMTNAGSNPTKTIFLVSFNIASEAS